MHETTSQYPDTRHGVLSMLRDNFAPAKVPEDAILTPDSVNIGVWLIEWPNGRGIAYLATDARPFDDAEFEE